MRASSSKIDACKRKKIEWEYKKMVKCLCLHTLTQTLNHFLGAHVAHTDILG